MSFLMLHTQQNLFVVMPQEQLRVSIEPAGLCFLFFNQRFAWPFLSTCTPFGLAGRTVWSCGSPTNIIKPSDCVLRRFSQLPSNATANWKSVMSKYATSAYNAPVVNRYFVLWGPPKWSKEALERPFRATETCFSLHVVGKPLRLQPNFK